MFVIPMDAEGVTVRPLRQISARRTSARSSSTTSPGARIRGGARRRRLGVGPHHADVRAGDDGLGGEGFGWRADRWRTPCWPTRPARATPRRATASREIATEVPRPALHGLPHAHEPPARPDPGRGGRAGQGHHHQGRDRGRRPDRRLGPASARPSIDQFGELVSDLPGLKFGRRTEEILRNMVGGACSACRPSRGWTRASRSPSAARQGGRRIELRPLRRAGVTPGKEAARGALGGSETIEAARGARSTAPCCPTCWPTAVEAGWPGLLVSEANRGAELQPLRGHARLRGARPRAAPAWRCSAISRRRC